MKIIDYVRASKAKKTVGNEFTKEIDFWKLQHKKMVDEFNNSSYKSIQLKVDEMPAEQIIFYSLSGSKMLNKNTMFSIDTTVIDNYYEYAQNIYPTFILIKDKHKQKEHATINNTSLYRINYNKKSNYALQQYEIETLIPNNTSTNKLFPEIFCTLTVTTNQPLLKTQKDLIYRPLKNYSDDNSYKHRQQLEDVSSLYENNILLKLKSFINNPNFSPDISKEF